MANCEDCGMPGAKWCSICKAYLCASCRKTRLGAMKRDLDKVGW